MTTKTRFIFPALFVLTALLLAMPFLSAEAAAPTPLSITTTSLLSGTVGTKYSASISASGGSGSYSWSLASGTLPPGLSLTQGVCIAIVGPCQAPVEISGTPTTAGTYIFTVLVNDGAQKASKEFTITVIFPPTQVRYFRYASIDNNNEWFIVKMTNPTTIQQALDDLNGARRLLVSGIVNSGNGGFNSPWSWHLDPATIILGENFIEVCDARPSHIEAHLAEWLGQRYCPWGARVNAVYDTPPTSTVSTQPPAAILKTFTISPQAYHPGDTVSGTATLEVASPVTASFRIELYKDGQSVWSRDINSIYLAAQTYTVPLETVLGFKPTLPDSPSLFGNWEMAINRTDVREGISQNFSISAALVRQPAPRATTVFLQRVIGTLTISPKNYRLGQTLTGWGTITNANTTAVRASIRISLAKEDREVWQRQIGSVLLNPGTLTFSLNDVFGFTPTIPASDFFRGHWYLYISITTEAGGEAEPGNPPQIIPSPLYSTQDDFSIQ